VRSINPTTGETVFERPDDTLALALERARLARSALPGWWRRGLDGRTAVLAALADRLRAGASELATLATREMGKPIAQAEAEVEKCAWACEWYAEHAAALLADSPVVTDASRSYVRCAPLGVVLAVMPWNFPYWQAVRAAAPALAAGNAMLLKHASNVPGAAHALERLFTEAGAPPGVFSATFLPARDVGDLAASEAVAAVTLTGSGPAGASLGERAGRALKKIVLELGGSDPFVVLADADVDAAAEQAVLARVQNNGQSCIAAKRFIVEAPIADAFETRLIERTRALVVGDPLERATQVGPLARADLVDELASQVERSIAAGAKLACGGGRLARAGCFYAPTVLTQVRPGMAAFDEETFGPLAPVIRARDEEDAVALANRSPFGLGASVWTRDAARGERVALRIEAGAVFVNGIVKSDPRLPFGGVKHSGHGRELGAAGIREFVNLQAVWVRSG